MTLCGWKIFTKNKQKIKCTKNEGTTSSSLSPSYAAASSASASASASATASESASASAAATVSASSVQQYNKLSEPSSKLPNICETTISSDVPHSVTVKNTSNNNNSKGNQSTLSIALSNIIKNTKNTKKKRKIKNFKLKKIKSISQTFEDIRRIKNKNNVLNDDDDDDDDDDAVVHDDDGVINKNKSKKFTKRISKSDVEDYYDDDDDDDDNNDDKKFIIEHNNEDDYDDGNPRNKCALKPGHSLMDWIRLGSSGCDLTGTKGVIRPVTSSELELHCKKDDAWLSIRGKVYNVTHYMDFHPGGPDELMKGVGKDATKIFDEIHAWVNYEQLLSKCYIGPLQNIVTVDLEPARSSFRKHQKTSSANGGNIKTTNSSTLLSPTISTSTSNSVVPPPPLFNISGAIGISSSAKTSPIKKYDTNNIYSSNSQSSEDLINPRFDWIQKTTEIVLIFYTKSFCNPGIIISYSSDCDYLIKIVIERMTYAYNLKLLHDVKWPGIVKLNSETGKMEIYFKKSKPELWINYGTMDLKKLYNADDLHLNYEFVNGEQITHDSYAICLRSCDKTIMITPIGYHVSVTAIIDGNDVTRSYTPVPGNYLPSSMSTNYNNYRSNICIGFLIKSYATGILAKYLATTSLSVNSSSTSTVVANADESTSSLEPIQTTISSSSLNNPNSCSSISSNINDNSKSNNDNNDTIISTNHTVVILSQPKGNFVLKKLINHYRIGLLAAGSGITPMLSVLDHLLMRNTNRIENIQFLLFNKTEKDIWCRQKLESIAAKDERLIIRHILSEPDTNWNGEKGRITKPLITSLCDKNSESYVTYCCICGPTQFNDLSLKLLKDIGFEVINLHFFQG